MMALQFSKSDFEEKVIKNKSLALVDFWAQWCGPCRMAGPVIDELAGEYQGKILIGKVNMDEEQELAGKYNVMSIPTVIIFKEGKEVERITGFPGKEKYIELIKLYIK